MFKIALISVIFLNTIGYADVISDVVKRTEEARIKGMQRLTKQAFSNMSKESQEEYANLKEMQAKEQEDKLILVYMTSQSLNGLNQISITNEVAKLNEKGANIVVAPIMRGLDDGVYGYGKSLYNEIQKMSPQHKENFKAATKTLKINPKLFSDLNITEVPVVLLGKCKGPKISMKTCTFNYKATGETTLYKISKIVGKPINKLFEGNQ